MPPAPIVDGAPVAPADLVPGVPNDLDTLCVVTLGPNDDGPHSPGELVRELEPWGEIRASAAETDRHGRSRDGAVPPDRRRSARRRCPRARRARRPGHRAGDRAAPVRADGVRAAGAARGQPAGTPPPATPSRATTLGAAAVVASDAETPATGQPVVTPPAYTQQAAPPPPPPVVPAVIRRPVAQATAASTASTPPPPPVPPDEPLESFGFGDVIGADSGPPSGRRFDPTALILILVVVAVIIGVVLAFKALFSSFDPRDSTADPEPSPSESAPAVVAEPSQEPSAPEESEAPAGGVPVIASTTSIDPSDADGEHQEDVAKAYDGDPSTFWYTQTYKRDDFAGFKDAVGYAITLTQKTTVSTVTLRTNSTGGNVEIRATDAANPTGGPVLASGPFGPETVFTLDPADRDAVARPVDHPAAHVRRRRLPARADGDRPLLTRDPEQNPPRIG